MPLAAAPPLLSVASVTVPSGPVLEAQEVTRVYGRRRALDGVSLSLAAGNCLALFGPNGAGKTTLLRILAGLLRPTRGTVLLGGLPTRGDASARAQVGLLSHQSMLYDALTVRENVLFTARLYGVRDPLAATNASLERLGMSERAEQPVRALSRGLQQRVSIARAVVHGPRVLLLDEPYTGLDEAGAGALTELLSELRSQGSTLVLVTHNLSQGLALATHAAVMRAGKLIRQDDRETIDSARYVGQYREMVTDAG